MVIEMGWLTLAMTVQLYLTDTRGYLVACGMLATYILYQFRRARRISRLVWLLSLGLALGSLGSLATGNVTDFFEPLHIGLCSLAVIGFFLSEYNREEDARFLARLIVILLPIAVWQSIARNDLAKEWAEGGRRGVNLAAFFLMLAGTYCFLLRKRWMLLAVPF
jgi:peptidoglycan/LPS O-acetylase OafA/YrhL